MDGNRRDISGPSITIIVPVHDLGDMTSECLGSIASQGYPHVDVVLVDDASSDGAVERSVAGAAIPIRLVRLEENVGLGLARNAGLAQASGDLVMFVDGDDVLADDALTTIADSYARLGWDLLLFGHYEWREDELEPSQHNEALTSAPPLTSLEESPNLIYAFNSAWNKAYDRSFLERSGVVFGEGVYEDIPFSYPILAKAGRVGIEPRALYAYRMSRAGSLLSEGSRRHFDVFDQVDRAWADTEVTGDLRTILFDKLVGHLLAVYDTTGRVPRADRREFLERTSAWIGANRPEGHRHAGRFLGLRRRLIERRAFDLHDTLMRLSGRD